jgi:Ca2+-binding RTX toxin-like protein
VGDPDTGNGAGNCNLTRKAAAEALVDWLATDPTGSGDADFLIIGDLNSYDKEDPIDVIKAGPDDTPGTGDDYTDMVFHFQGEGAYSYVFDGQLGYLDHALAPSGLLAQVTGVTIWHINADEPSLIDYDTTFKGPNQEAIYAPDAYRSSDHDAVIVGLDLTPPVPQCNGQSATVYVDGDGVIVGGLLAGEIYDGLLSGTNAADVIVGTEGSDHILSLPGDDLVCALGGEDLILGGAGADSIFGGGEKDAIFGGNGLDILDGGAGQDLVDGGLDGDILSGGDENDIVQGGPGNDSLNGGNGSDLCNGGLGSDTSASCEIRILIP